MGVSELALCELVEHYAGKVHSPPTLPDAMNSVTHLIVPFAEKFQSLSLLMHKHSV